MLRLLVFGLACLLSLYTPRLVPIPMSYKEDWRNRNLEMDLERGMCLENSLICLIHLSYYII